MTGQVGRFPDALDCRFLPQDRGPARQVLLDDRFRFVRPSGEIIEVPKGYCSDGASIPRPLWVLEPPYGDCLEAAIPHDWSYSAMLRPRAECDQIFLEALTAKGIAPWKRNLLYLGVRAGGWQGYGRPEEYISAMKLIAKPIV